MVISRRKFSRPKVVPWELIDNYSKESTIHGMKYLGEKQQHWIVRIFWIAIFVVSITLCVKNMKQLYHKRQDKPVMVSIAKELSPTFDIPFPAVTICPEMKTKCDKINMTEILNRSNQNYSDDEIARVAVLSHVCTNDEDFQTIFSTKSSNDKLDVVKLLDEMSLKQDDIFDKCRFSSWKYGSCEKLFSKTLTDVGICYTFNMLNYKDYINVTTMHADLHYPKHDNKSSWFLDKDYNNDETHVFPRRIIGKGLHSGLSIKFKFNSSLLCPSCMTGVRGFRVSLHMPVESAEVSKTFYNVPFNRETNLIVKPDMIYPSKEIKPYLPEKRHCYFEGEKQLKYFVVYSKTNCDLECKADYIKKKCGCVKFSMPRTNDTAICQSSQLQCAYEAETNNTLKDLRKKLIAKQLKRDLKHGKTTKMDPRIKELETLNSCKCMPSCTSIKYDVEISQTDYDVVANGYHMASLNIYFRDAYFMRLKRYEIYGWTDYLSNSGGILGLFMGCSVLSFIEIFFHLVVYCIKKCKKHGSMKNTNGDLATIS